MSKEQMMTRERTRALSDVLDQLESAAQDDRISIDKVVEKLGHHSFASLMLISTSPASAIPGITAIVAVIIFILVVQMIVGRQCLWLPDFIAHREIPKEKLCKGIGWLRKPVRFVEKFLQPRLTFLLRQPWLFLPLFLILGLTLVMPLLEAIPTSGSIASAMIALFAAGLLTRDGAVATVSVILMLCAPVAVWQFGFAG
jgi:hypothetical protein